MIQTLSDALSERGYDTLTPVQEAVTDPGLSASDLLVSAQTGSGKTVGFGLAIGPTLLNDDGRMGPAAAPLALIVAPTRELAFQVTRELDWLYAKAGARVASCVGGMDMRDERRTLDRGAHIVVGTPGRLRDHIQRGSLDMGSLRAIVLDEADEMLDLGFREDLEFMLGEAPADRRTLMFSATVPPMIVKLAQSYQRDAVRVTTLTDRNQHADIAYQALTVAQQDAENAIINVLRYHEAQNAIVFANTRAAVNRLTARFANRGFAVVCLSGELSQTERTHALQAMRDGRARVCVATDVAARGIDLPNLELVVHAELPSNFESLLHRSGRTGRAGRKGTSALIVPPRSVKKAERLLKMAKVKAEWTTAPGAEEILRRDEERLLADPMWTDPPSDDETAFAERLLGLHPPQAIAAAYLRLFRERHSAPEELAAPDARPSREERKPFGPSAWISLSVGRNDKAEPRWLLPLLCRAGGLDKDAIGAIRVQQSETFVELTEASLAGFMKALDAGNTLEDGITARRVEGTPDVGRRPDTRSDSRPDSRPEKPPHRGSGPRSGPSSRGPRPAAASDDRRETQSAPAAEPAHVPSAPRKPEGDLGTVPYKPRKPKSEYSKPAGRADGPGGKPKGKPFAGKPSSDKPYSGKPPSDKPYAGKPKKAAGAGKGKPAAGPRKSAASDTSKRFEAPNRSGGAKPKAAGAKRGPGGMAPPKRPKS